MRSITNIVIPFFKINSAKIKPIVNYGISMKKEDIQECQFISYGHTTSTNNIPEYMYNWIKDYINRLARTNTVQNYYDNFKRRVVYINKNGKEIVNNPELIIPLVFELYTHLLLLIIKISDFEIGNSKSLSPRSTVISNIQKTVNNLLNFGNKQTPIERNIKNHLTESLHRYKYNVGKDKEKENENDFDYIIEFLQINNLNSTPEIAKYISDILKDIISELILKAIDISGNILYPCHIYLAIDSERIFKLFNVKEENFIESF